MQGVVGGSLAHPPVRTGTGGLKDGEIGFPNLFHLLNKKLDELAQKKFQPLKRDNVVRKKKTKHNRLQRLRAPIDHSAIGANRRE